MSQKDRMDGIERGLASWVGQSEPESHIEHQAALDATLFHSSGEFHELVFELDAGELRIRRPRTR
jgi:hypothetical protein